LNEALQTHAKHPGVQDTASWALLILAWSNIDFQIKVKEAGTVRRIRKILKSKKASQDTKERVRLLLTKIENVWGSR
jgi:hypothetical protein